VRRRCPECGVEFEPGAAPGGLCPRCSLDLGLEEGGSNPSETLTLGQSDSDTSRPVTTSLAAGARLGRYEILGPLGRGGMGQVLRARDHRLGREVALKILDRQALPGTEGMRRLRREAQAVSRLSHPHVCTLYDLETHDDVDFLVMELLRGETLAERLARGPLGEEEALRIATEIASALGEAHRQELVHRDLKPANVMLTEQGAKLLDFGVAKALGEASSTRAPALDSLTRPGTLVGTLQYMAPEQLEGREVDARTDCFAFGALVLEMLTGRRAFDAESEAGVIGAILHREPPALAEGGGAVPEAWRDLLRRLLAKSPDERPQSMEEVEAELERIGRREGIGGDGPTPAPRASFSLAVLRFDAAPQVEEVRSLADGLTEEVFTRLSRWGRFPVVVHHVALGEGSAAVDLQEIRRELGVRYVVLGSVRGAGGRARIHARLVEAETGTQVWGDRYDGELEDAFQLQDDVAVAIVAGIRRDLWDFEHQRVLSRGAEDSAWDHSQRGFALLTRFQRQTNEEARRWFEKALRRDPGLINAGYGLVMTYFVEVSNAWAEDPRQAAEAAMAAARRLIAQDESSPLARIALSVAWYLCGDLEQAISSMELAVELDPGHNFAQVQLAFYLALAGRVDAAEERLAVAEKLGIEAPLMWSHDFSRALIAFVRGDDAVAAEMTERCLRLRPQFRAAHTLLAACYAHLGREDEGRRILSELERRPKDFLETRPGTAVGRRLRAGLARLKRADADPD